MCIAIDDFCYLVESKIIFIFKFSDRTSFFVYSFAVITECDASFAYKRLIFLWLPFLPINLDAFGVRFLHCQNLFENFLYLDCLSLLNFKRMLNHLLVLC